MKTFGNLIYSPETATGEVIAKVETHTPKIEAPEKVKSNETFEVKVIVGPHPNTIEHHIKRVELYFYEEGRPFNPILLVNIELTPMYTEPILKVTLRLKKSGILYALAYCNLHGLWEARKEVKVE